jgi:hypothetical protein
MKVHRFFRERRAIFRRCIFCAFRGLRKGRLYHAALGAGEDGEINSPLQRGHNSAGPYGWLCIGEGKKKDNAETLSSRRGAEAKKI